MKSIYGRATRLIGVAVAVVICLNSFQAEAARVSPMILEIKPTGRDSIARVELTNDADRDIPYEVEMMRGEISPEGELALTPADEQFIVFPPQAMVEARTQQVFRIQYVGDEAVNRSQVYYLSIKQIPVEFEGGRNQVQVVINYNVLVNVVPDGTAPIANVKSASYIEREQSLDDFAEEDRPESLPLEKGILIDLANDGNRYFFAGRSEWSISAQTMTGEEFEQTYRGDEMSSLVGAGVVAPGKNRIFFVPTDVELDSNSIQITVAP